MSKIIQSAICRTNRVYRPSPSLFYFPGLTSKPIWNNQYFPEISSTLEENYNTILTEYQSLVDNHSTSDYSTSEKDHQLHTGKWEWYSYIMKGQKQDGSPFKKYCPKTVKLLESFQQLKIMDNTPFSYCFFSRMHPTTTIASHTSPCNLRLRCHFPLIVPKQKNLDDDLCGMRVADQIVSWNIKKPIFFDDSYEHEGSFPFYLIFFRKLCSF
jgi:aspartyl/asparaginyl beta-hydroxylase (cupin superfamily)